jgi:hypothetical protein
MMAAPCRGCAQGVLVASLTDGKTLHERQGDDRYGGYTWLDAKHVAYFVEPPFLPSSMETPDEFRDPKDKDKHDPDDPFAPKPRTFDLMAVDIDTNDARRVGGYPGEDAFAFPTASPDGKSIAVQHASADGNFIAVIDVKSGKLRDLAEVGVGENPAFSPDGSMIVYTVGGDVRLYHLADGKIEELTKNPVNERYPAFSPDGSRVYFESLGRDPNFSSRQSTVIAYVSVTP